MDRLWQDVRTDEVVSLQVNCPRKIKQNEHTEHAIYWSDFSLSILKSATVDIE